MPWEKVESPNEGGWEVVEEPKSAGGWEVVEGPKPTGQPTGYFGSYYAGLRSTVAHTEDQLATLSDWIGAEGVADHFRGRAGALREMNAAVDPEGFLGNLGYMAGAVPLEMLKFFGGAKGLEAAGVGRLAARVGPGAWRWLAAKSAPWAVAGGGIRALEPGATPTNVAGEAVLSGAIPATAPLNRLARLGIMGTVGTGKGLAEGKSWGEALEEGAIFGGLSFLPGRERLPRGARMARRPTEVGDPVYTNWGATIERQGVILGKDPTGRGYQVQFVHPDGTKVTQWVPGDQLSSVSQLPSSNPAVLRAAGAPQDVISAAEVEARHQATRQAHLFARGQIVQKGKGGKRYRFLTDDGESALVTSLDAEGNAVTKAMPLSALQSAKNQGMLQTPAKKVPLEPTAAETLKAAEMIPEIEQAWARGAKIPDTYRIGARAVDLINGSDDLKRTLDVQARMMGDFRAARGQPTTWNETYTRARRQAADANEALSRRQGDPINEVQMARLQDLENAAGENLDRAIAAYQAPGGKTVENQAAFITALSRAALFAAPSHGAGTTAARALAIRKAALRGTTDSARQAIKFVKKTMGSQQNADATIELLSKMSPDEILAAADRVLAPSWGQKGLELWKMGLLSGPTTHVVNNTSNLAFQALDFVENALAAGIGKLHGGDKVFVRELGARMGTVRALPKALKNFARAYSAEQEGYALNKLELSHRGAIGGTTGKVVRTPGRLLVAEDELWKTFAYESELHAQAWRRVLANKKIPRSRRKAVVEALTDNPDAEMQAAAERAAHKLTFTTSLGTTGKKLQSAIHEHPLAGFIIPFFRTPTNIAKEAIYRVPLLGGLTKTGRSAWKAGGAERDQMIARQVMGGAAAAMVAGLVKAGYMTGGGPTQPGRRQAKFPTWQPYSIRMPWMDRWISYNRLEPVGMVLGMAADATEAAGEWGKLTPNERAGRIASVFTRNLASKTFIKGLADWTNMAMDPERSGGRWSESLARSFVPAILGQTARAIDPTRREVTNPLEAMQSAIPGLRERLPASATVTGETATLGEALGPDLLSPFYGTFVSKDPVAIEIGRLADEGNLSIGKPSRLIDDVQMSEQEWSRYWGEANRRAHDRLLNYVTHERWDSLPTEKQVAKIKSIYAAERRRARSEIRRQRKQTALKIGG